MKTKKLKRIKKILGKNLISLIYRSLFFLSDEAFIRLIYRLRMGKKLNLDKPVTFNEKLQWLKLNDHNPLYTKIADKLGVRDYVREKVGKEHVVPVLAVYSSFDEIDFSSLPSSFVLKTTHDSGSLVICPDKSSLDIKKAGKTIMRSMKRNYYKTTREWQYKNIEPKIIAEKYLGACITDYKFFCFNGEPRFMYIEREGEEHPLQAIFDMTFSRLSFTMEDDTSPVVFEKPQFFDEMKRIAGVLSSGIPFVRVDMYYVEGKILVGELTFYHYGGFIPFNPPEWDRTIGGYLNIEKKD